MGRQLLDAGEVAYIDGWAKKGEGLAEARGMASGMGHHNQGGSARYNQ